jgi:hypothetical protein
MGPMASSTSVPSHMLYRFGVFSPWIICFLPFVSALRKCRDDPGHEGDFVERYLCLPPEALEPNLGLGSSGVCCPEAPRTMALMSMQSSV